MLIITREDRKLEEDWLRALGTLEEGNRELRCMHV